MPSVASESRKQAASRPSPPLPSAASRSLSSTAPRSTPMLRERVPAEIVEAQIDQVVGRETAREDTRSRGSRGAWRPPADSVLGLEQAVDHEIAHGEADTFEELAWRKGFPWLRQRVSRVSLDGFPERGRRHQEFVSKLARSLHCQSPPTGVQSPSFGTGSMLRRHAWLIGRSPATLYRRAGFTPSPSFRMEVVCSSDIATYG